MNNKDNFFQFLRGLSILVVVLIHSFSINLNKDPGNASFQVIIRQLINFPVPLFFFISGYFVKLDELNNTRAFLAKKLLKIIPPYLVWSLIGIIYAGDFSIRSMVIKLATGTAFGQLYFIVALIQLILLTPFMGKTLNNKKIRIMIFLITPIYLAVIYTCSFITKQFVPFDHYALPFTNWIVFYYYGLFVRNPGPAWQSYQSKRTFYLIGYMVTLILSIGEGILLNNGNFFVFAVSQIKISSFLASFFLISLLLARKNDIRPSSNHVLVRLGDYSFGIFLSHYFFLLLLTRTNILGSVTSQPEYVLLMGAMVVCASFGFCFLGRKILGTSLAGRWLGFV